jgi:plasmid maintenance system killer protein
MIGKVMTKKTVRKRILAALHEENITSNDIQSITESALVIKLKNICTIEGISMEKYDVKSIAKEIMHEGFNELQIPLSIFFRKNGFSYNKLNILSYLESYSSIQKDVAKFDSHFSKNQIGSLHMLFLDHRPKNLVAWRKLVFEKYGDNLKNQTSILNERITGFIEHFSFLTTASLKRKVKKEVEGYVESFIINKSYHGFMIQYCTIVRLAEYLGKDYHFESMGKGSKCTVDAFIGKRCVSVKPLSFEGSEGKRFVKNSIPIIYYGIEGGNIILNYRQFSKGQK